MTKHGEVSSIGTIGAFINGRACSDTLLHVLNEAFESPSRIEERAVMPMAGGIMQHGYQCGMIWGAALAAGGQAHRLFGSGPLSEAKAVHASRRLVERFRSMTRQINCSEITHIDKSSSTADMVMFFLLKGGTIKCFRLAGRFASAAHVEIERALAEDVEVPGSGPVSCAAVLARKMGASERHVVMASALAGGIGLSGGGCGALGAAIWLRSMKKLEAGAKDVSFKGPEVQGLIDGLLKHTEYELECSKIVGRVFADTEDHARYLRNGGCSRVIELLGG